MQTCYLLPSNDGKSFVGHNCQKEGTVSSCFPSSGDNPEAFQQSRAAPFGTRPRHGGRPVLPICHLQPCASGKVICGRISFLGPDTRHRTPSTLKHSNNLRPTCGKFFRGSLSSR